MRLAQGYGHGREWRTKLSLLALRACVGVASWLWICSAAGAAPPEAWLVGGKSLAGTLIAVDQGTVRFATARGERTAPLKELVRWGHPVEARRTVSAEGQPIAQLLLADGGVLLGALQHIQDEKVLIISDLFDEVELPLAYLRGVILQPPADRLQRDRLARRIEQSRATTDRLILVNGDELTGRFTGMQKGVFSLQTELGPIEAPIEKVAAIEFNSQLVSKPAAAGGAVLVGCNDGSLLTARGVTIKSGEVALQLAAGVKLLGVDPQAVVSLQPLAANVVYLSDLPPHSYKHVPYLTTEQPYAANRSVAGGRLSAQGRLYSKGLGAPSASRLAFKLERPYARFAADAAIDDAAGTGGSAVFRVFVHRGEKWEQAYASSIVRGGDQPASISVELKDAKAMLLVVDYADRADVLDHADWLDARLESE